MINFLPEKLKKQVKEEYTFRVVSAFLIVFSLTMVFVLVFLTPSHILSVYRKAVISDQLNMIKSSTLNQTDVSLNEVKKINEIVKVLSSSSLTQKTASGFIKSVVGVKNSSITISSISVEFDSTQNIKIGLKGFSKTRDGLTKFVKDIKDLKLFSSVDLPISSLVKSADVDFTISLVVKKE
ncbi:MAG: hypothetical protein WC229_01045 [Candidatus Paceibacterota bacterium]|jgi:hypothetical protein